LIAELLLIIGLCAPPQEAGETPAAKPVPAPEQEGVPAVEPTPIESVAESGPAMLQPSGKIDALELRFDHAYTVAEINLALEQIAARAPQLASLETIGKSANGQPLRLLTLSDPRGGRAADKPAILMLDFSKEGSSYGAETALAFAQILLDEAQRAADGEASGSQRQASFAGMGDNNQDELEDALDTYGQDLGEFLGKRDARQILRDFTVIIAPALDPDRRALASPTADGVDYDQNFPLGWMPDSLRPGSGDYPFSKPETEALAVYLGSHPNLALVLGITGERADERGAANTLQEPWPGASLPAGDRQVFQKLGGIGFLSAASIARQDPSLRPSSVLSPWGSLGSLGGGLFDYAFQRFGIYSVAWSPTLPGADELVSEAALFQGSVRAMALQSVALLGALPRVRLTLDGLSELAPGLWQLDVAVRNSGVLPTLSELGEMRRVSGDVRLTLAGAKLLATGLRAGDDAAFQVVQLETSGNMVSMGAAILGSGETRWLRLVLEGEAGSAIELVGRAARGGTARLNIVLEAPVKIPSASGE